MIGGKWLGRVALVGAVVLLATGCRGQAPAATTAASQSTVGAGQEAATPSTGMPVGASVVQQLTADLDGDGQPEQAVAYELGGQLGIAITPEAGGQAWSASLAAGVAFAGLRGQDVDADGHTELLLETQGPEKDVYGLGVIRWVSGRGQFLAPQGGPTQSSPLFRSRFYPPFVQDINGNINCEIVVSVDGHDPAFLDSVVYEWDGEAFIETVVYLVPPRPAPTPAS